MRQDKRARQLNRTVLTGKTFAKSSFDSLFDCLSLDELLLDEQRLSGGM